MSKNILRVLRDNEYFYLHDGSVIKSIKGLTSKIKAMDDGIFRYHVNQERNDFANWVGFLSDDLELKGRLMNCRDKDDMAKMLKNEIDNLSKISVAVKKAQLPAKPTSVPKKKAVVKKATSVPKKKAIPVKKKASTKKQTAKKASVKKKSVKKEEFVRKAPGINKNIVIDKKSATDYITSGIKEYLLGIITGLILGLIIGAML